MEKTRKQNLAWREKNEKKDGSRQFQPSNIQNACLRQIKMMDS